MLNDIQAVDSDRSTLVTFAGDLALSVLVKGIQDQAPQEVQNILSWAQDNLMTITLLKLRRWLLREKLRDPFPLSFWYKTGRMSWACYVYLHSNATNWDKQIDALLSKAERRMHIFRVCKKYGFRLDSQHHLFHSWLYLILLMAFQYGVLLVMISIFPKLASFRKEQFGLLSFRRFDPFFRSLR